MLFVSNLKIELILYFHLIILLQINLILKKNEFSFLFYIFLYVLIVFESKFDSERVYSSKMSIKIEF
jgi:hypothetical protein